MTKGGHRNIIKQPKELYFTLTPTPSGAVSVSFSEIKKPTKLSQHQKFRKASYLTTELATVISETSHTHFYRRLELVKDLIQH